VNEFKLGYIYAPSVRGYMQSGQDRRQVFIDKPPLIVAYDSTALVHQFQIALIIKEDTLLRLIYHTALEPQ
jgi:hypothetical protein